MGIVQQFLSNLKNKATGIKFADYRKFVTDDVYLNTLKYTFERIQERTNSEKIESILNFDRDPANLSAVDFANLEDSSGCSLLQLAASHLNAEACKVLLENGADVNHTSLKAPFKAYTPLTYALGTKGKIVYPEVYPDGDIKYYLEQLDKEKEKALYDPKDFDKFKSTVDILLKYGGAAFGPLTPVFTDKQVKMKTAEELVVFAIRFLDDDKEFYFEKSDENGNRVPIQKSEMIEYLLEKDKFKDFVTPELLSYAKLSDYTSFRMLLDTVPDKVNMLNEIHKFESTEIAYYHAKAVIKGTYLDEVVDYIESQGYTVDNIPNELDKKYYNDALVDFMKYQNAYNMLSSCHMILTEYDSEETFDFKKLPYYTHRYIAGEVVDLYSPKMSFKAYKKEAEGDLDQALENYKSDICEVYPRILKHGNINHFLDQMEDELTKEK